MKNLAAALLKAQQAVKALPKDAKNEFSGYWYTTAEAIFSYCKDVLTEHGLVAYNVGWEWVQTDGHPVIQTKMTLAHPESGEVMEGFINLPCPDRKGTPVDKAACAALTTAMAYWLRGILQLPRGEGIDDLYEGHADEPKKAKQDDELQEKLDVNTALDNEARRKAERRANLAAKNRGKNVKDIIPKTISKPFTEFYNLLLKQEDGDKWAEMGDQDTYRYLCEKRGRALNHDDLKEWIEKARERLGLAPVA